MNLINNLLSKKNKIIIDVIDKFFYQFEKNNFYLKNCNFQAIVSVIVKFFY